jgi:NagD protein
MSELYAIVSDVDGVLHRSKKAIPGAAGFVRRLQKSGRPFLFLTNSPDHTPEQLVAELRKFGIQTRPENFYTSAQAIGAFVKCHSKKRTVYLMGSTAVKKELILAGAHFTDRHPEFVIVTSGGDYEREGIDKAVELVCGGSNLITANREHAGLTETGIKAGCGALIAPIETATRCSAYVVGKPNHLMIRGMEERLGVDPANSFMIGDSLDTDIDVGMQAEMKTILVLSGMTSRKDLKRSPIQPDYVFENVGRIRLDELP